MIKWPLWLLIIIIIIIINCYAKAAKIEHGTIKTLKRYTWPKAARRQRLTQGYYLNDIIISHTSYHKYYHVTVP